jgi:hypothetical protein
VLLEQSVPSPDLCTSIRVKGKSLSRTVIDLPTTSYVEHSLKHYLLSTPSG